ncbi:hypothetical protein BDU57DRAFT_192281 [Ampelomyces quisqualis]|uniref:Uncharacterized protein n=1 Tax=Ampelomyces quisqualis TaxID=50730 RepID=A0A6A5QTT8_AMPQU|nr:hypothetical protein BDU57DRAFT_192281 [Ampelomyces quisqualis]
MPSVNPNSASTSASGPTPALGPVPDKTARLQEDKCTIIAEKTRTVAAKDEIIHEKDAEIASKKVEIEKYQQLAASRLREVNDLKADKATMKAHLARLHNSLSAAARQETDRTRRGQARLHCAPFETRRYRPQCLSGRQKPPCQQQQFQTSRRCRPR